MSSGIPASIQPPPCTISLAEVSPPANKKPAAVPKVAAWTTRVHRAANTAAPTNPVSYLYIQVSKSFLASNPTTLYLTVDYYGQVSGNPTCSTTTLNCALIANYDSTTSLGAYGQVGPIEVNQGASWQSVTWKLTQSSFQEAENNASDFRLGGSPGVAVHSITLSLTAPPAASSSSASSTASSTTATASSTTSSSSSSSVPKTGGNPLVPVAGGAAVIAGAVMLMDRRRPKHAD